jgi:hypothetical protein
VVLRRTLPFLVFVLLAAGPASADPPRVHLTVTPGDLSVAARPATVTSSSAVSVRVVVVDATGSGRGWTLRAVAARPVSVASVVGRCMPRSTCTLPRPAEAAAGGGVVLRAARGTGMGRIELTVTIAALPPGSPPTAVGFSVS